MPLDVDLHKALSGETRKRILLVLGRGRKYLSEIADAVHKTPQTVDFHLRILEEAGFVSIVDVDGKRFYELTDPKVLTFVERGRLLPPGHHPKSPHELMLDVRDELMVRMDRIEEKLDLLLKQNSKK